MTMINHQWFCKANHPHNKARRLYTMNNTLLLAITIYCALLLSSNHVVHSFSSPSQRLFRTSSIHNSNNNIQQHHRTPTNLFSANDKQAEIAALEERLRQLKQEEEEGENNGGETDQTTTLTVEEQRQQIMADAAETLDADELASLEKINEESDDSIMFSEKWKETNDGEVDGEGIMGTVRTAALAIGLIVFLGVFSQVPVGETDLQRYQDIKGSTSRIDLGDLNPGVTVQ